MLIVVGIAYLSCIGFPSFITERIVNAAARAGVFLEFDSMKLDVARGIVFEKPQLFAKGTLGPAFFEASRVWISFSVDGAGDAPFRWLDSVNVAAGTFRPRQMRGLKVRHKNREPVGGDVRVSFDGLDVLGLNFAKFACSVVVDDRRFGLVDISAWLGKGKDSGPLGGSFSYFGESGRYMGSVVSGFDTSLLGQFLRETGLPGLARFVDRYSFPETSPSIRADFTGCTRERQVHVLASFEGRDFCYNDVPVVHVISPVRVDVSSDREMVILDSLTVRRPEGEALVRLEVDLKQGQVGFDGVSSLNPAALANLIVRGGEDYISDLGFGGAVRLCARGLVSYERDAPFEVEAYAEAETLRMWHFDAENCSFAYRRSGRVITVSDIETDISGGHVSGWAYFSPEPGSRDMRYRVQCKVRDASFREVAEAVVGELPSKEGYSGNLSGNVAVEGLARTNAWGTINGAGKVKVRDGKLFRLPLFGGLSAILVRIVPGLGYVLKQTDATADFTIDAGKIKTQNLWIEGDILSLRSAGSYSMVDDSLDYRVELRFLKQKTFVGDILQTIFLPVSKMFRIKLGGTAKEPDWSTVNF